MQRILGYMRKAITEFDLISDGDKIAVGISGGKDSLVMLAGLARLKSFIGIDYDLIGLTVDPMFGGVETDYTPVAELCQSLGVRYHVEKTDIGRIVFDIRKEQNPCSLCANMRRGALHNTARDLGCNKVALGHHYNDVAETFLMNLFIEGRIGCFSPKTYLDRSDVWVIRPLVFAREKEIKAAVRRNGIEVVKSKCPADGSTKRQEMKEFLRQQEQISHGFTDRIFGALRRSGVDGWGYKDTDTEEV